MSSPLDVNRLDKRQLFLSTELDPRLDRFEDAWNRGPPPNIADFLVGVDDSLRQSLLEELVAIDLERRWRRSSSTDAEATAPVAEPAEPWMLESYIRQFPQLAENKTALCRLLVQECQARIEAGQQLTTEDIRPRFPELWPELESLLIRQTNLEQPATEVPSRRPLTNGIGPVPSPDIGLVGQRVAHFKILAHLGSGGMGKVYLAKDERLGRQVALKVLASEFTRDADRIRRFERESRAASALNHPNIITIYDIGQSEIGQFIVMELVTGRTLNGLIRQPPPLEVLADVGRQIAESLEVAHAAGIVHRDIKPQNIMVRDDGYVKVLDFGLVRLVPTSRMASSEDVTQLPAFMCLTTPQPADGPLASSSLLVGTASYMSPEQAQGQPVTTASDMFSLGIVLYQLATGRHPFAAESALGYLSAIVAQAPIAPSSIQPDIPADLETLILALLEKDPHRRPTPTGVRQILSSFREHGTKRIQLPIAPRQCRTVGRELELAQLQRAFDRAWLGRGELVCVTGEPGIGKTTLVEDFLGSLASTAHRVQIGRGRCSERLAGTDVHLPFLDALDSLLHGPHCASSAELLRTVAPSWHVQLTPLSSSDASSDPISVDFRVGLRDRMKRELAAFLAEIARERPFVLFLEDLHWADVASIELLAYLTTKFDQLPVLVIAAARPTELMLADHPFLHVKLDLKSRGICQEMALGFLSREAVGQYVSREFPGHRFPQGFIELIYAKTEGSPLFLVDLLRHLRDRQLIVPSNGSWQVVAPMADVEKEAPESVRSMIQRKMDQLDDTDRRLLSTASVQGSEFDAAVVARVHKMDILDAEERLDRLDRVHSFVRCAYELELPNSSLTTRYRFVHALYQNAFYSSLRTARRVALSLKVAKSLLRFHGNKANELATELAILFEAGRDFQQAGKFYLAAARSAGRRGVHRQEAVLLSQAIRIAERLGQKERIAKLRARRGTAFFMVGLWQDARPELDAALADLPAEQFALRAKVLVVLASVCHWLADVPNTRRYAGQALELAELAGRNDLAAAALGALALADSSDGKLHASLSGFEQAFVRTERVDTARMAPHLELSGLVLYWLGRPEEAIRRNRDALQIGRSTSDSSTVVRALGNLGIAQTAAGRYDEALRVFDEAQRLGKEYEVGTAMARAMAMRAGLHLELCDFARAEALTEEARDMGRSLNFSHPVISGGLDLMFNFVRRGDVGRAERLMDEVAEGVRKGAGAHGWLWKLRFAQAQAELALARGSWDEALRQADSSIAQGRATGRVKYEILGLEAQAKAHAALGRQHQAIGQLRSAIELARSIGNPAMFLRVAISLLMIESDEALAAEARAAISRISAALPDEQLRRCFQLSEPVQWLHRAIP